MMSLELMISSMEGYGGRNEAFIDYRSLVREFRETRNLLRSDSYVLESRTINIKSGALLTSKDGLDVLQQREEQKAVNEELRASRTGDAEEKRAQYSTDMARNTAARESGARKGSTCKMDNRAGIARQDIEELTKPLDDRL